jgi:transcriptional regulator with XRE-family HTH domain
MDETSDREIGRRIAALRTERGWSQGWLASLAGMTQSVLSRVEAGKREARASELERLARALGVGPEALLEVVASSGASRDVRAPGPVGALLDMPDAAATPAFHGMPRELEVDRLLSREAPSHLESRMMRGPVEPADDFWATAADHLASPAMANRMSAQEIGAAQAPEEARLTALAPDPEGAFSHAPPAGASALPAPVARVIADYLRLRAMVIEPRTWRATWAAVDSLGRRHPGGKPSGSAGGRPLAAVSWNEPRDRYARLWRHELGIGVDGPVPDLVALFEDAGIAEIVVARLAGAEPVCAGVTVPLTVARDVARYAPRGGGADTVSFLFVNADRPVTLQRYALVHAFAHLALGHGDVVDQRIEWSRATPPEAEANDFAEEFLAPVDAVGRWYTRHDDPEASVDVLLELGAAFGITFWSALYRSRAAGRVGAKPQARIMQELRARQWELLPEQSFRGGLRDTLSTLAEEAPLPPPGAQGVGGVPARLTREAAPAAAVLRVPARLRRWTLQALRGGRLSLEEAAAVLRRSHTDLAAELERLGLE